MKAKIKMAVKFLLWHFVNIVAPVFSKKSLLSAEEAQNILTEHSQKPTGTSRCSNELLPAACDLQIVVSAYNAETYLKACIDSILQQKTRFSFHVVIVDDGSTDNTGKIADSYAEDPRITVIHQENQGHSGARNTGLQKLFGKFITFVDSDDLLCEGAVEALMETAYKYDCDYVEGGMYELLPTSIEQVYCYQSISKSVNPYETFHGFACGKIIKAEKFQNMCFPTGFWYEDTIIPFLIWPQLKEGYTEPHMIYYYRQNPEGISAASHGKVKSIDTYWITEQLMKERAEYGLKNDDAFLKFMLHQIRINYFRTKKLDKKIQESIFVLTCKLMKESFPDSKKVYQKNFQHALDTFDFGMYSICCSLPDF